MNEEELRKIFPEITPEQLGALTALYEGEAQRIDSEGFKRGKADGERQLAEYRFDAALENALQKSGARSTKAVKALLSMEEIALEDGQLTGLDGQLERLKAESGFLFEREDEKPRFTSQIGGAGMQISKDNFRKMSYRERLGIFNSNPELYNELNN